MRSKASRVVLTIHVPYSKDKDREAEKLRHASGGSRVFLI